MTEPQAQFDQRDAPGDCIRVALLISAALIGVLVTLFSVKYVVNDDPSFAMILSGSDGFEASADVPFISRLLSQLLVGLYGLAPTIPWYGITLYLSAWLGLGILISVPLAAKVSKTSKLILIAGWAPYLLFGLYNISMTNVTLWLQLGVFLQLLMWLRSDRSFRLRGGWLVAGLVVGYLWRWEMFLVFAGFGIPLLLFVSRKEVRKCVPILVVLCLVVSLDRTWEFVATGKTEYRQYESFNRIRGRFHDRTEGQLHAGSSQALREVGWSENDYRAYHELWMLYDKKAVSGTHLKKFVVANAKGKQRAGLATIAMRLQEIVRGNRMVLPPVVFATLALLLLHAPGWWQTDRSDRWRIVVSLGLVAVAAGAICYVRFVSRVSFPLFLYILGLIAVVGRPVAKPSAAGNNFSVRHLVAAILALSGIALATTWARVDASALRTETKQRRFIRASVGEFLKGVKGETPVLLQLDPGVALLHVGCGPFRERVTERSLRIFPSGWSMRSARYQEALAEIQVNSGRELLATAAEERSIYFVLYARPWDDVSAVTGIWETYYREHFGGEPNESYRLDTVRRFESAGYQLLFFQMQSQRD